MESKGTGIMLILGAEVIPFVSFYKCLYCVAYQCLQEDTTTRMYQCSVRQAALLISRVWLVLLLPLQSWMVILVLTLAC